MAEPHRLACASSTSQRPRVGDQTGGRAEGFGRGLEFCAALLKRLGEETSS
jgi:hypothetical protein